MLNVAWRVRSGLLLLMMLIVVPLQAGAVEAPATEDAPGAASTSVEDLELRRTGLLAEIASLGGRQTEQKRRRALERLERVLAQLIDEKQRGAKLELELSEERATPPLALPQDGPPYSIGAYDAVRASVDEAERLRVEASTAARDATISTASARDALDRRQRRQREEGGDTAVAALELETAERTLELRRAQLADAKRAVALRDLQLDKRTALIEKIGANVRARPGEKEAALATLAERSALLEREREEQEQRIDAKRAQIDRLVASAAERPGDAALRAELEANEAELLSAQRSVALLAERTDRLERARELTEWRFALFSDAVPDRNTLRHWREQSAAAHKSLEREVRIDRSEMASLTQELADLGDAEPGPWTARRVAAVRATVHAYDDNLEALSAALRRERNLQAAVTEQLGSVALADRLSAAREGLASIWSFEVTASEDRSVTVGKIVIAFAAFLILWLAARLITQWGGSRLFKRVGVDEGAAHAYQSLAFYTLVAIAFLVALRIVDIPLTAFAVVGGALAIGIGFGSQNIVNNFISGVILLAERPIKRGDLVDVDGTYGNIERVGLRSTRVRTGDNIHVIVPNSALLENRVINWTHNDANVRVHLKVGVIYGSPTREVERLILQALDEHERVLDRPGPMVLFMDFGDDALIFEALFWMRVRSTLDRLRVESDLRFRVDELFREAKLVIAFPQRDVHLDAEMPIPIQIVQPPAQAPGEAVEVRGTTTQNDD